MLLFVFRHKNTEQLVRIRLPINPRKIHSYRTGEAAKLAAERLGISQSGLRYLYYSVVK